MLKRQSGLPLLAFFFDKLFASQLKTQEAARAATEPARQLQDCFVVVFEPHPCLNYRDMPPPPSPFRRLRADSAPPTPPPPLLPPQRQAAAAAAFLQSKAGISTIRTNTSSLYVPLRRVEHLFIPAAFCPSALLPLMRGNAIVCVHAIRMAQVVPAALGRLRLVLVATSERNTKKEQAHSRTFEAGPLEKCAMEQLFCFVGMHDTVDKLTIHSAMATGLVVEIQSLEVQSNRSATAFVLSHGLMSCR